MVPSPIRLNPSLIAAAEKEGMVQNRSTPKQIEFWAYLGRAVEHAIDFSDVLAVRQGLKRIKLEHVASVAVASEAVFANIEKRNQGRALANDVTASPVYFEASKEHPGLLDRVDVTTGIRQTGQFRNGAFESRM